jgi:hypothetical protein
MGRDRHRGDVAGGKDLHTRPPKFMYLGFYLPSIRGSRTQASSLALNKRGRHVLYLNEDHIFESGRHTSRPRIWARMLGYCLLKPSDSNKWR